MWSNHLKPTGPSKSINLYKSFDIFVDNILQYGTSDQLFSKKMIHVITVIRRVLCVRNYFKRNIVRKL